MYIPNIFGLILSGATRRDRDRVTGRHSHNVPSGLEGLSDHHLRDIGYTRDRSVRSHRHVIWM